MMEKAEESRNDFMQRLNSCSGTSPSTASASMSIPRPNRLDLSNFNGPQVRGQFRHFPPSPDAAKRIGIPPAHPHFSPSPYQQISTTAVASARSPSSAHLFTPVPTHSRSLSQPAFFSLDSLSQFTSPSPPLAASSPAASDPSSSADVEMDDRGVTVASSHCTPPPVPLSRTNSGGGSGRATGDGLPPKKAHRRSQSDIPFGFLQSSAAAAALPPLPHQTPGFPTHLVSPRTSNQFVKQETEWEREGNGCVDRKSDGDVGDDLFSAYMNLESFDTLNSSGTEEKREDSRASCTKTNGADSSENEAESSVNESGSSLQLRGVSLERKEGNKRSAAGDPAPINFSASCHNRSISMDSFMGKLQFGEESPKLPPSPGLQVGQHSHSGSLDGMTNTFSLEFGNGEFSGAELKKIMANEKLAEIAMADPKRAKRILANRQSAARSKERKMRYISELEHKVQTLQTEATTLSAQLTLLQRDSAGLTSQNNELKFRLQAMEQQAQLRDALNEALTSEVQRLKLTTGEAQLANSLNQQMQLNPQMFSLQQQLQKQHQQSSQISHYQMQPQQQQQQQKKSDVSMHDSNK